MALTIVGDSKQSIFKYAGADPNIFTEVETLLNPQVFPLSINYRSTTKIIDTVNSLGRQISDDEPIIPATSEAGLGVEVVGFTEFNDQALYISSQQAPPEDTLIICRTGAHCAMIASELKDLGYPVNYNIKSFWQQPYIRAALGYLVLAEGPGPDKETWARAIKDCCNYASPSYSKHTRYAGRKFLESINYDYRNLSREKARERDIIKVVEELKDAKELGKKIEILDTLFMSYYERKTGTYPEEVKENITALNSRLNGISAWDINPENITPPDSDGAEVLTAHKAKGTEADYVYIIGACEAGTEAGTFPHYLAVREGEIEEERRIFYVALSRGRKKVSVLHYAMYEGMKKVGLRPSRFIEEAGLWQNS